MVEDDSDQVYRLFEHLKAPATRLYVPALFDIECANILWKYVRRFGYAAEDAQRNLRWLQELALVRAEPPGLLEKALRVAIAHDVSVYDACYVALAAALNVPLVTADRRLAGKFEGTRERVVHLSDFSLPAAGRDE